MHCGHQVTKHSNTYYECTHCGHKHYRNPVATVGIALHDGRGGLICSRRKFEPYIGHLDCIGGFVDFGENNEQALARELQEEVGITMDDIGPVHYLTSVHAMYPWMGRQVSLISALFIADLKDNVTLTPGDDVDHLETVDLHQPIHPDDFEDDWMYTFLQSAKDYLGIK